MFPIFFRIPTKLSSAWTSHAFSESTIVKRPNLHVFVNLFLSIISGIGFPVKKNIITLFYIRHFLFLCHYREILIE